MTTQQLIDCSPCEEGLRFLRLCRGPCDAWFRTDRPDWLLWYLCHVEEATEPLKDFALWMAERVTRSLGIGPGESAPLACHPFWDAKHAAENLSNRPMTILVRALLLSFLARICLRETFTTEESLCYIIRERFKDFTP